MIFLKYRFYIQKNLKSKYKMIKVMILYDLFCKMRESM